jgi:hypothetical protein
MTLYEENAREDQVGARIRKVTWAKRTDGQKAGVENLDYI